MARNKFRQFCSEDENWKVGGSADKTRLTDSKKIQVFWLPSNGRRKYVGKVFPDYTERQAIEQFRRIRISTSGTPQAIDDAVHQFDRFFREARAYSHIDQFCARGERIYFPKYHGVVIDMQRSRFSCGYAKRRTIMLEAIKPDLRSRRILAESVSLLPEGSLEILAELPLSTFEREWYHSLLNDRLRRLDTLHRIGITHGDVRDCHFRLPNDFYDTVLYDFSEAYTFSPKRPFRGSSGRLRPLKIMSEGERKRVEVQIEQRANARDFRSHLISLSAENTVDDALSQSLDKEKELLELIIFKVRNRPDYFSMPTLNSVFPFLESVCPKSDPGWHIRRGRLLHHYESVWAVCSCEDESAIIFDSEAQFETIEVHEKSYFMLCLIPKAWNLPCRTTDHESTSKNAELHSKLRQVCLRFSSSRRYGYIVGHSDFLGMDKKDGESVE